MIDLIQDQALAPLTWWKIGGPAEFFCQPATVEELKEAVSWAKTNRKDVTVLSGGSNVLISDRGVAGLVIHLAKLGGVSERKEDGRIHLEVLSGTAKGDLVKVFLREKLSPAIFLCGIPGDVGGGVVMNAGVGENIVPREFAELVDWVEVVNYSGPTVGVVRTHAKDLKWTYRSCEGWGPGVIARVGLSWPLDPDPEVPGLVRAATRKRIEKQPLNQPSCGSTFKNPPGGKAGALIDQCGLKGFQVGEAQVSSKHANFIVNLGGATAYDVDQVIRHVQATVRAKTGFELLCEVKYLGRW